MSCYVMPCLVLSCHITSVNTYHVKRLVFPNTIKLYTTCNEFHIFWGFSPPRSFKLDCFCWETSSCLLLCAVGVCRHGLCAAGCCVCLCVDVVSRWVCAHAPWLRQLSVIIPSSLGSINAVFKTQDYHQVLVKLFFSFFLIPWYPPVGR